jgi:hypothetical protein
MGETREQRIIKQLSNPSSNQKFTAVANDMYLPNYSGILDGVRRDKQSKICFNLDGGIMIKLINKTGGASIKGQVVHINSAVEGSVTYVPQGDPDSIGVFYENGVADGQEAWVVVSGIAQVYFVGNTTAGHFARTFVAADGDYVLGQAKSEAIPTSPFATDKHFCEIGHVIETRVGAGLAKCVLHFN